MRLEEDAMFTCPMHPHIRKGRGGLCPECGMRLVAAGDSFFKKVKRKNTQNHKQSHHTNVFKRKFWLSFILSIPVVFYSEIAQKLLGYDAPIFFGSSYIPLVFSSLIFFYGGWVFIVSAYRELKARMPGMMTLIALAVSTAYIYSVYVTFFDPESKTLFWELATLITVMLLGHWMEMRAVAGAQGALKELSKLIPDKAEVLRQGNISVVSVDEIRVGDLVLVKPGGKIPVDGIIEEGESDVNESIVTGESKPIFKKVGDEVIAGTVNGDGSLKVRVSRIGEETFLAGVMRLVEEAQSSKSRIQALSDRAAYYLTLVAVVGGGVTFASWLAVSDPAFAIQRTVAVLVIACPHALGLAIPLVASISTTKAAQNGFLVKQRLALEAARNINIVLFDKTGTLTKGEFGVDRVVTHDKHDEEDVLRCAASVNSHSEHPIGGAIVREAQARAISLFNITGFQRVPGMGVQALVDGQSILVGNGALMRKGGVQDDPLLRKEADLLSRKGRTVVYVARQKKIIGLIALSDIIREESYSAVKKLHEMGIKTAMITGDSEDVARWVSTELGIDQYFANVLPNEKSERVKVLQKNGFRVAMVGDGVNDAPALMQADVGIAIGAGTNVALESAGIILVKNDPRDIPKIIRLSQLTYKKMVQNLFWAAGYNVVALPLAAGALAFRGIILQPAVAAVLMSLSTVIVALNAILLRRQNLE